MSKIPNICLITYGALPVPDTKGGAIERLLTMIAEDNEHQHRLDITILGCEDYDAKKLQRQFNHTSFINFKAKVLHPALEYIFHKIRRGVLRFTGYDIHFPWTYAGMIDRFVKSEGKGFDLFVSEGYDYEAMSSITRMYGKEKVCWHLHMNPPMNSRTDKIFGRCIAVSDFVINKYRAESKNRKENSGVVFNGIDTKVFQQTLSQKEKCELRHSLGLSETDFVIVYCGRIVPLKGIKQLAEAVVNIDKDDVKLLIIGSSNFGEGDKGSFPLEFKQYVSQHPDKLIFTGYIKNQDVFRYHQIADVGAIPSLYQEACPLSLMELITSGLPTISTRRGALSQVANSETTIFVDVDYLVENLEKAIVTLYNDKSLCQKMSKAAIYRSQLFSRERFYNDFCNEVVRLSSI